MGRIAGLIFALVLCLSTTFPQQPTSGKGRNAGAAVTLTSPAFAPGGDIPEQYTCKGADSSPALEWRGTPAHVSGFALIADDPDAPQGTWTHWIAWNLPPSAHAVPAGVPKRAQLDDGTKQGRNDFHNIGYNGPCPPPGKAHRYFFRLYALNGTSDLPPGASRADVDAAIAGHIVAQAEYMGTFHR
jgi:hypothetical protein